MSGLTRILAMSAALLTLGGSLSASASAAPSPNRARADGFMNMTYTGFAAAAANRPTPFNWGTDGCSIPPQVPLSPAVKYSLENLFRGPCKQHDFGYRNYGRGLKLGRDEGTRDWIDGRLLTEMRRVCARSFPSWWQAANKAACRGEANAFYVAVRNGARDVFYNG